jgi:hypothetical protein
VQERTGGNENCAVINGHVAKKKWRTCLLICVVMLYDKSLTKKKYRPSRDGAPVRE